MSASLCVCANCSLLPLSFPPSILFPIWRVSVNAILKTLNEVKQRKGVDLPLIGRRLSAIVNLLREFYNADGNGLGYEEMDNEAYKVMENSHDSHVTFWWWLACGP